MSPDISELVHLVLRVGVAALFIFHAPQKWLGWFGGPPFPLISDRSLASLIEFVCSPLIALGLFTSYAALACAAEMIAAYWIVHLPRGGWPIENRGEVAVLFFLIFVYLAGRGGGVQLGLRHARTTPRRAAEELRRDIAAAKRPREERAETSGRPLELTPPVYHV